MVQHRLGKKVVRHDSRTFKLSNYIHVPSLVLPDEVSWIMRPQVWPMYLNDTLGDCVEAAQGHMIEQWDFYTANGKPLPTDSDILNAYESIGGYNPDDPTTDQGSDMLSALNFWRKVGVGGHKIIAYVSLANLNEIKAAIYLFGNAFLGIQLPVSAQGQDAWTVTKGGTLSKEGAYGSWGGHCVPAMAISPKTISVITWGERLKMSHNFYTDYTDEAYAVLSLDWLTRTGMNPGGFNLDQLKADLLAL